MEQPLQNTIMLASFRQRKMTHVLSEKESNWRNRSQHAQVSDGRLSLCKMPTMPDRRDDDKSVKINFTFNSNDLVVSHTGKPFTAQELAALLSGGSSKEFDDAETTGRFGTGFLVTHALSTHVDVDGVLSTQEGQEFFHIKLARDGDEKSIEENIEQANESLDNAKPLSESYIANNSTASFTYYDADCDVAQRGLDRLKRLLPYLYVTCEKLGQVRIERQHRTTLFKPANTTKKMINGFVLKLTEVTISEDETTQQFTALRIGSQNAQSALLAVLENCDGNPYRVVLPEDDFPRIFVKFPIAGTDFLPFNVVLDGSFAPQPERDSIAMNEPDKCLVLCRNGGVSYTHSARCEIRLA